MTLKKCTNCGIFFGGAGDICSKCATPTIVETVITDDTKSDIFTEIKDYLYSNQHVSPVELMNSLNEMGIDITIREIMSYINEGRLTLVTEENMPTCSNCGEKIMYGTMCADCNDQLEVYRIKINSN